jgi:hypothetical protein
MAFTKRIITALFVTSLSAYPQEVGTKFFKNEKWDDRYYAGSPIFSPLVFPAYTPEMGFYLTGGGLLSFKTKRNNDYLTHSTLPIMFGINKNSDFYFESIFNTYWFDDRLLLCFNGDYQKKTDHYWGIGITNAKTISKSESTTQYENESYKFNPSISLKIFELVFFGLEADFNKTSATKLSDLMLEDKSVIKYGRNVKNAGMGIFFGYDSRDVVTNPYKGFYIYINGLFYSKSFSGDYDYKIIGIDYRHYLPLIRKGSILALEAKSNTGFGNVPWTELQKLGTQNDLRGFYYGQYRDKSSILFQLEYRHTFSFNSTDTLSRHGFVFWVGGGSVFPEYNQIKELLFSTGAGYRYEVQPRKNVRLDIGFGTENVGIYIGFNETF